ncbi:hypothetical protein [Sphingobacterium cellulitidis]|uniref:hypothetical protein n=1 Tax=Sphingobacterium cellulitidis TaxID=1768011 RepID=UPI003C7CA713
MNNLKLAIVLLAVSLGGNAYSQDLLSKVPADSKMVVGLNGKGFFKHADVNQLNSILKRAGLFETITEDNEEFQSDNIEDLGIDLNSKAYVHFNVNDSLQFLGAIIPLKNKAQFEAIFPKDHEITVVGGMNTIYSEDKTLRISWDQNTAYILGGMPMNHYFDQEGIKEKYGLLELPQYEYADDYVDEYDYQAADSVAVAADSTLDWEEYGDFTDTLHIEEEKVEKEVSVPIKIDIVEQKEVAKLDTNEYGEVINVPPPAVYKEDKGYVHPPASYDEFGSVDSVLARDEYQDDYYQQYSRISNHNDSIKNDFVNKAINKMMDQIISGNIKGYKSKQLTSLKDNELVRIEVSSFDSLMYLYYPKHLLTAITGGSPAFDYGYEAMNSTILVEGNRMKMVGDLTFDKEMTKIYKEVYNKKINPKLLTYLNDDALGFLSFNLNSEAYLKHMPRIVQRAYGGMDAKVGKIIDLFVTGFDIVVDEKAVAKVFKGDNLLILNGVSQKEVKYIDYEYDEDYNYTEIEKTKMEKIPNYIWMFSSDDTRIFEKIFSILELENNMVNHNGIYEIMGGKADEFAPYILIQDGIVFLGNDLEQMEQIKDKTYRGQSGGRFATMAKKNKFALLFNTKKVPEMVEDLKLPVHRSMEEEMNTLSQYGDIYMISNGMKGKKFLWEAGVDFPKTSKNGLDYLINSLDNISKSLKD